MQVANNAVADWYPVWSPDGTEIAFGSGRYEDWEIFVMDADGSNVMSLGQQDYPTSWGG